MNRYSALALICSLLGCLPLAAGAVPLTETPSSELVPADSFIVRHVGTVPQLHQQISLDPVVRRRLARHFHTSAPAVTRYIQDNLVLTKLKQAGRYQVYCVGRSGQEYVISSRLAAGTPVFVLRSTGQPVLKLACGNPMMASLPPVKTKVAAHRPPALAPAVPSATDTAPASVQPSGPVVVAMANAPGAVVMPTTKVAGFLGQLPAVHGGGGGFPLAYLAGIPLLAAIGSHGGGNGNSGSTPNTGTTGAAGTAGTDTLGTTGAGTNGNTTGNTGVTPVPEPSTPAAFAVGGAALVYLLGSAKRRRSRAS